MKTKRIQLTVKPEQFEADKYRDMVRIDSIHRKSIQSGQLVELCVEGGQCTIVAVRGVWEDDPDGVYTDLQTRRRLGVKAGETHTFTLRKAGWLERVKWAANANDPAARIATWIALVGFCFAIIDLLLGVVQVWQGGR